MKTPTTGTPAIPESDSDKTKKALWSLMQDEASKLSPANKDFVLNLLLELQRGGSIDSVERKKLENILRERNLIQFGDIDFSEIVQDKDLLKDLMSFDQGFSAIHNLADDLAGGLSKKLLKSNFK